MIDKSLSARSKGQSLSLSRHRGFSLIEVMMSIVLIAIGMTLAVPSYRDMVEKRQVTNGAEQLASFINAAQGVAMKTNRVITVSYARTAGDNWCVGAIDSENACDCTVSNKAATNYCQIDSEDFIINHSSANDREMLHSVTGDGAYAFDPVRGIFQDLDDGLTMELRSVSGDFRLNLVVNNTGRVTLCSDDAAHAVPGYDICEQEVDRRFVEVDS